ncbi:hypothetical protein [Aureispira anguillae]|uniref:Uncharacterized protein n=1 Tax=Aureispira anguillae TaxID=2864201 RepID=A0A915YIK9_9BACT|nr:hypothetical protein [Aureispira anguillae]BDS13636.1 hypothetical protein AsAng_0043750 [Aureispira anguillae]
MKQLYWGCLTALLMITISACSKYEPIFGVAGTTTNEGLKLKKDLVYIHRNDIYLVNEILSDEKRLTNNPSSSKTHVALSPQHDKIAYLNVNKTPVIIDTSGNVLETLSQHSNVKDILWHKNNGNTTLVILKNNNLYYHGPAISGIPSNPFDYAFPSDVTFQAIDAIDISDNLDVFFTFRYQRPFSPTSSIRRYYHGVGVNLSSTNFDKLRYIDDGYYSPSSSAYSSLSYPYFYNVKYNEADQNATIGYITNGNENDYTAYQLSYYSYQSSSNFIQQQTTSLNSANYYHESDLGHVASNPSQIRKYLTTLPTGVPPPTGTPNTYTINFSTQNTSPPTYFDWNP